MSSAAILVVEDEVLIRMMIVDMLHELGHRVVADVGTVDQALKFAREGAFDAALLDVNLGGQSVTPLAKALSERRLPFVFASGYGEAGIPKEFHGRPVLQKPFQADGLRAALDAVLDRKGAAG